MNNIIINFLDNYLSEIISGLASIAGVYTLSLTNHYTISKKYRKRILNLSSSDFSDIICYTANSEAYDVEECSFLGYPFEYMGVGELNFAIKRIYKIDGTIPCVVSKKNVNEYLPEDFNKNIILIGGPIHNSVTKKLVFEDAKGIPFNYDGHNLIYTHSNNNIQKFSATKFENNQHSFVNNDYALILNIKNPKDRTKRLLMISGCHSIGVYGGAFYLSNCTKQALKTIKDDEYALIIECKCNETGLCQIPILKQYVKITTY